VDLRFRGLNRLLHRGHAWYALTIADSCMHTNYPISQWHCWIDVTSLNQSATSRHQLPWRNNALDVAAMTWNSWDSIMTGCIWACVANSKVKNCDHHLCSKSWYTAGTDYSHQHTRLPDYAICDDCCASSVSQSEAESVTMHCGN
jgi:hypothetical protein